MSDIANLNIVIGANVSQATQGLETVSQGLAKTAVAAGKVDSSLASSAKSTNTAAFALQNLGRVAQDAPFGFIAIQNNLNPLLESFQRLRAETGSAGAALKALGSTMLGPAGLGIALSVISSAILLFSSRSKKATDSVEETGKAVKTLSQVLEDSTTSVQGQIAKVNALVAAYGDSTAGINTRKAALAELTKIDKEHFGALDAERSSYIDVKIAADAYTQSLISQAIVKGITDDITALSKQLRAAQKEYVETATAADKATRDIKNTSTALSGFTPGGVAFQAKSIQIVADQSDKARDSVLKLQKDMKALNDELQRQVAAGLKLFHVPDDPDPNDNLPKATQSAKDLGDAFKTIRDNQLSVIDNNKKIEESFALPGIKATKLNFDLKAPGIDKINDDLTKSAKIVAAVDDAFDSLFNSIASGANVFDAIGGALKKLLVKLVATVIEAAILSAILNAIFPGLGAAGAFSFGNLFSQLAGLPKFAGGGVVTRPTLALVGESGPEQVTPLGQLSGSAGNIIRIEGEFVQHGSDLRAVVKRADRSANTFQ